GRDGRYFGYHFAEVVAVHRKERQAAARGEIGAGLSDWGFDGRRRRYHPAAVESRAGVRNLVRWLGRGPSAADENRYRRQQFYRKLFRAGPAGRVYRHDFWHEGLVRHATG